MNHIYRKHWELFHNTYHISLLHLKPHNLQKTFPIFQISVNLKNLNQILIQLYKHILNLHHKI